jgi:hypothetical protein
MDLFFANWITRGDYSHYGGTYRHIANDMKTPPPDVPSLLFVADATISRTRRPTRAPFSPLQLQLMFFLARRSEFIPTQFRRMRRWRPTGANKYGFIEAPPRGKRI